MPKFSAKEREKIYESLLENGEKLFNEKGFYAVTAEDIALSSDIAKGTFYHFFKNKEHLYMVINNNLQARIFSHVQHIIEKSENLSQRDMFYDLLCYIMDAFIVSPLILNIDGQLWKRLATKAPRACIEENDARDLEVLSFMGRMGFSFRYELECTMKILQIQFVQLAYLKEEKDCLGLMRIVLKALSEHLILEDI